MLEKSKPNVDSPFVPETLSFAERAAGWKAPPSKVQVMLWSGSKRHVLVGMLGLSVVATIPWLLLTSGKQHDSHADYMDRAEGARRSRLSNAQVTVAPPTSS